MKHTSQAPLVSVVIPVFNGNGYLAKALTSILNQTYRNLEVLAIDDGSTDDSYDTLKKFAKLDSRVRIYRNPKNQNISRTLNRAIKPAKGKYIARMDADDIAMPNRIRKQTSFLQKHPQVVILGGQVKTMDITGKIIGRKLFPVLDKDIREALYTSNPIQHPTAIFNLSLIPKNFSWYNPALPPAEDYDLFFRLARYGKLHNLPLFVLKYRQYLGSSTFKNPVKTFNVTKAVRHLAVTKYGYQPSGKAKFIHLTQVAIVYLMPEFLIYPVYALVRGIRSPFQLLADYLAEMKFLPNLQADSR